MCTKCYQQYISGLVDPTASDCKKVTKYVNTAANITTNPAMKEATQKEIAAANNKGAGARVDAKKIALP